MVYFILRMVTFFMQIKNSDFSLKAFTNADFGGSETYRKDTSGTC